jgi:hypothetical protein
MESEKSETTSQLAVLFNKITGGNILQTKLSKINSLVDGGCCCGAGAARDAAVVSGRSSLDSRLPAPSRGFSGSGFWPRDGGRLFGWPGEDSAEDAAVAADAVSAQGLFSLFFCLISVSLAGRPSA